MQIIYTNFTENDSFEEMFSKYKDEVGELFQNGNQILDNADYKILYRRLANIAQWSIRPQLKPYSSIVEFERNLKNETKEHKFFFRCFGIYLREAVMRYGADLAGESNFWANVNQGITDDLNEAFNYRNKDVPYKLYRQKKGFWDAFLSPEKELRDKYSDKSLFEYIFSFFDNPTIKNVEKNANGVQYMHHLLKLAVCPLNYNPLRSRYNDILDNVNNIPIFINACEKNSLSYHPNMKKILTGRILNYFKFLPRIRELYRHSNNLDNIRNNIRNFFHIESDKHYYIDWFLQDIKHKTWQIQNKPPQDKTDVSDYKFVVSYNTINNSINVSAPSDIDLDRLFGEDLGLEPWAEYQIESGSNNEFLFKIENTQILKGENKDSYNSNIFKLYKEEYINIIGDDVQYTHIKNPWYQASTPHFIFDHKGVFQKNSIFIQEKNYLILPQGTEISSLIILDGFKKHNIDVPQPQEKNGLSLYEVLINDDGDNLIIELSSDKKRITPIELSIFDPRYLHLYESEDSIQATKFMAQQRTQKVGIGSITFTHLPEDIDHNQAIQKLKSVYNNSNLFIDLDANIKHAPRLVLSNKSNQIIELPQENYSENKIIPSLVLLPKNVCIWQANTENHKDFSVFLKSDSTITNLDSKRWIVDGNKYRYNRNGSDWENAGSPISFTQNGLSVFSKSPYWIELINYDNHFIYANDFFWGNNPFDDLMPPNAQWHFEWEECNRKFSITVPTNNSISKCLECFQIENNFPDMKFGWKFENTQYILDLHAKENNYHLPQRDPSVYDCNNEERSLWLKNLLSKDINALKNYAQNISARFGIETEISINNCNTIEDVKYKVGTKYIQFISNEIREDLANINEEQKKSWIDNWLSVSDWDGLLKILLDRLQSKEDRLYKTISEYNQDQQTKLIKKFCSEKDIECFVSNRFFTRIFGEAFNAMLKRYNLVQFRTEIEAMLINNYSKAQLCQDFDNIFGQIALEFRNKSFKKFFDQLCKENNCTEMSLLNYFPNELANAGIEVQNSFATNLFAWCKPLFDLFHDVKIISLYIPECFPKVANKLRKDDISLLSQKFVIGLQQCIRSMEALQYSIEHSEIASLFNITEQSFNITPQNNHNFDFSEKIKNKFLQISLKHSVHKALVNKLNLFEKIPQSYYSDYIKNTEINDDVYHFLEFVNQQNAEIFRTENQKWRIECFGLGMKKEDIPPTPGECLLFKTNLEFREYAKKLFKK